MDAVGLDIELTPAHFSVGCLNFRTNQSRQFEMFEGHPLDISTLTAILRERLIVTFNGTGFDIPLLMLAMKDGVTPQQLKRTADSIINGKLQPFQFYEKFDIQIPKWINHIDLIEVAPNVASLKIYGGRIHCPKLQDMPVDHNAVLTPEQVQILLQYNINDLQITKSLYEELKPQIELREQMSKEYGVDLRSKSDAQMAETIITKEVSKKMGPVIRPTIDAGTTFKYLKPDFIEFKTDDLQSILSTVTQASFTVPDSGQVVMPKEIANSKITIGSSTYQLGIGGLHSTEQSVAHIADADCILVDRDVVSYYPSIILNLGLAPAHMAEAFTHTYKSILARRLEAKKSGDKVTANCLKIVVNGSFGKFGSKWSKLYSPNLMIQTTLTGQLCLLMLIELLELENIPVVSANTDGIVIKCPKDKVEMMAFVIWLWETQTNFETEETHYSAIYSRDVNNYIAIKTDGGVKRKGAFAISGLQKNPTNEICIEAVTEYLRSGTPIEQTIRASSDIRRFVTLRRVNNGAMKDGVSLGRAIRWYYASGIDGAIHDKINNYTVPRTEGAKPILDLPDQFPSDVNFDWYIEEANSILQAIGAVQPEEVVA